MGSGGSKPAGPVYIPTDVPPPRREEADYPVQQPIGISKGTAQGCVQPSGGVCQFAVPQGVSSSGAKLYRDQGTIRRDQCRRYANDLKKVANNQKSFEEVKKDLVAGLYYEDLGNEYCRQITYAAEDVKAVLTPDKLPADKVRYNSIRKMSDSGSYSSVTKLFIKPSIPFKIELNGKPHTISVMTLMHPSPIRMENVQHDAMLTLGDPGEKNNDGLVVLVPLQGSLMAGASGEFMNKVTRYMTGVLQPDPATGDYKELDIPTGNDWDLSKLFPGTPEDGKTYVTNVGYYVWIGYPPLELVPSGSATPSTTKPWYANLFLREPGTQRYSWEPQRKAGVTYVMLSKPTLVNSMDLQTIRMLPVTPVTEAVAPIATWTLSYRKAGKVGANGEWESSCSTSSPSGAIADLFSGGTREGVDDTLKCDPFASLGRAPDNTDAFVKVVIAFFTACAVGVAIYLAVLFFTKTKWGQWTAHQGTLAGNYVSQAFVSNANKLLPPDKRFEVTPAMEAVEAERERKKAAAEEARVKREEEKAKKADEAWLKKEEAKRKIGESGVPMKSALKGMSSTKGIASIADYKSKRTKEKAKASTDPERKAARERAETRFSPAGILFKGKKTKVKFDERTKPEKPEDAVTGELPAPGTPAAAAVAKAGEEAAAALPPASPAAPVTNDVIPTEGPAAAAVAQAGKEAEAAAKDTRTNFARTVKAPKTEASESKVEAAQRADLIEAANQDSKIPEDFDADAEAKRQAEAIQAFAEENKKRGEEAAKDLDETRKRLERLKATLKAREAEGAEKVKADLAQVLADTKEAEARAQKAKETADEAKITAEEAAEKPKPSGPKSFANVRSANGPDFGEAAKHREAKKKADEAAKAAAEAEAAAKRLAEEEARLKKAAEEEEARIKKAAEEAAKSASKVVESRAAKPASLAEPIMRKPKSGDEGTDKFNAANPMLNKRIEPKTYEETLRKADTATKAANAIAKPAQLSASQEAALTDADKAAATKALDKLRDKVESDLKDVRRRVVFNLQQAEDKMPAWVQFENEKKLQHPFLSLLAGNLDKFAKAIEESKLPQKERAEFIKWLDEYKKQYNEIATAAKKRLDSFQVVVYTKGGGRRRMKRKSTRRYVA